MKHSFPTMSLVFLSIMVQNALLAKRILYWLSVTKAMSVMVFSIVTSVLKSHSRGFLVGLGTDVSSLLLVFLCYCFAVFLDYNKSELRHICENISYRKI